MSLKLLAPGKRRNKTYYIIGSLDGNKVEKSTGTDDRQLSKEVLATFLEDYRKVKKVKKFMSFAQAADGYKSSHALSSEDTARIDYICGHIGGMPVMDVVKDDIYRVAEAKYAGRKIKASTKNRYIITPASAVLNYAAANNWRAPIEISRFKEATPAPRYVTPDLERILNRALRKKHTPNRVQKRLLLLWIFRQGDRISDILRVRYEHCNLDNKTIMRHVSKSDRYVVLPLDETICRYLRRRPEREGPIFIWRTRFGAAQWLQKLSKKLGVAFTPHMGRHTLGKRLNDAGAGLKTIMQILGQSDPRSAIRYQTTGIEELRTAKNKAKVGETVG